MTPDSREIESRADISKARNDVKSLIEEARECFRKSFLAAHAYPNETEHCKQFADGNGLLDQALTLLHAEGGWQEFDPKREETWPKEQGNYILDIGHNQPVRDFWIADAHRWLEYPDSARAYQSLPQPYLPEVKSSHEPLTK